MMAIDEFGKEYFVVSPFTVKELDTLNKNNKYTKDEAKCSFTEKDFDLVTPLEISNKIFEYYYLGEKINIFHSCRIDGKIDEYYLVKEKATFEEPFIVFINENKPRVIRTIMSLVLLSEEQMKEIEEETRKKNEELKNNNNKNNEVKSGKMEFMRKEKLLPLVCKPLINWTLQDYVSWCHNYGIICNTGFINEKGKYPCIFYMDEPNENGGICIWETISFRDMIAFKNLELDKKREEFMKELMRSIIEDEE